ncbi:DUF4394 domain-containing protein [Nocardioides conyzicola]|uniref:DUF4394 domain-containing protein n=1 Tax=Nocardioides conyzicola TaxID=1651781 RepID=A0ABP8XUW9_9ACTN
MRTLSLIAAGAVALAGLTVVGATISTAHAEPAFTAYALSGTDLLSFDIADPATPESKAITGVGAGETLVGLDVRPQNGELYALGVNATADTATLYVVHPQDGFAAAVGTPGSVAFTLDGSTVIDLPDPSTVGYGFDVNPAADRVRVTAGGLNFRVSPTTGAAVDGNTGAAGTNPDGPVNGGTTTIDAAAYTNDVPNNGNVTTLYTLDAASNSLYIQNPPNNGTQMLIQGVTLGGSALDFTGVDGFDIPSGVNTAASNTPVASGSGYAVLSVGGSTSLYTVDLVTGAATAIGTIGTGTTPVQGLALQRDVDEGYPAIGLSTDGTTLVRFSTVTPATTTTQALNLAALGAGETLAAIAWRPQTGQLLGLGVNAATDTGTLYVVDPQSGVLTRVGGSFGLLAWVDDGATTVDLPDPSTTAYALDVNPVVDRVRVTAGGDLNARVNPVTGAAVDGNAAVAGVNPDGSPGLGLGAIAYTNGFGRNLSTLGATTTLYALEPVLNQLVVVDPPNSGTLTNPLTVKAGAAALDFEAPFVGLDIPEDVPGTAYAVLLVGGTARLYAIDLASARATNVGDLPSAVSLRSLTLGQAGANRPVPPPPVAVPASLTKAGATKQVKKTVDTGRTLACPSAFLSTSCTTTIKVTATYKVKVKGKTRTRSAVVGKATVKTARGKSTRLKVTLSKGGVKLLKQRKTLAAKVAITAPTGPEAAKRTTTVKVKLSKKKL